MSDRFRFRAWNNKYKNMTAQVTLKDLSEGFVGLNDNVIMQSTGLRDKNGVLVFEGDIVKYPDRTDHKATFDVVEPVEWQAEFGFNIRTMSLSLECVEVIGNVYQDSHLLCESKDI